MKVFITGGTGTVGTHITKALIERGDEVVLLTRNAERVKYLKQYPNVALLEGSMSDLDVLSQGVKGVDAVIHMALGFSMSPYEMLKKDTLVTAWLLEQAAKSGVGKFLTTSTVATMKNVWEHDVFESDYPSPMIAYGGCKAAAEMITLGYYLNEDGPVTMKRNVIRPTNCYSVPAFPGGGAAADDHYRDYVRKALRGEDIEVKAGDGEQFISGRQIAQVYLRVLDSDENEQVFFAAGNRFVTWEEIAQRAIALVPGTASKVVLTDVEARKQRYCYNPAKIKRVFGLSFDGLEDLDEYLSWELERARREQAGEALDSAIHTLD